MTSPHRTPRTALRRYAENVLDSLGDSFTAVTEHLLDGVSLWFGDMLPQQRERFVIGELGFKSGAPKINKLEEVHSETDAIRAVKDYSGDKMLIIAIGGRRGRIVLMDGDSFTSLYDTLKACLTDKLTDDQFD